MKKNHAPRFKVYRLAVAACLVLTLLVLSACSETDLDSLPGLFEELAEAGGFTINENAAAFLEKNEDLFPAANALAAIEHSNYDLEFKQITKNPQKHGDQLMVVGTLSVIKVIEEDMTDSTTLTEIQAYDTITGDDYYIFYPDSIEVYEGDTISAFLLPLDTFSFENVGGGTTISLACAGSYIVVEEE